MYLYSILSLAGLTLAIPTVKRQDTLPSFIRNYAPLFYLHSQEVYLPSDIGIQVENSLPEINYSVVGSGAYNLDNLDQLNAVGGSNVYLTSKEGIQALPEWFRGARPNPAGVISGVKTGAVVFVDKPDVDGGVVDVFYFSFYAYNQGNSIKVFGIDFGEYGDHVGDWEHTMIRFKDSEPQAMWYSQHAFGQAFTYDAVEKRGTRPVVYVGNGTHANWATTGLHDHTLQVISLPSQGLLTDYTDAGFLYDPLASSNFYKYDTSTQKFSAYDSAPVDWLYFDGQWGDQQLPNNTPGQMILFNNAKYSNGPNGPKFKDLDRAEVCLKKINPCIVSPFLMS